MKPIWTSKLRIYCDSRVLRFFKFPEYIPDHMMDEREFQRKAESTFEALKKRLLEIGDENGFEVEGGSGKLEIEFEDEDETRFVISPNAPVRQIWISALTTSFKLAWSDAAQAFVQEKTGENLNQVMSRILTEKLGKAIEV